MEKGISNPMKISPEIDYREKLGNNHTEVNIGNFVSATRNAEIVAQESHRNNQSIIDETRGFLSQIVRDTSPGTVRGSTLALAASAIGGGNFSDQFRYLITPICLQIMWFRSWLNNDGYCILSIYMELQNDN